MFGSTEQKPWIMQQMFGLVEQIHLEKEKYTKHTNK